MTFVLGHTILETHNRKGDFDALKMAKVLAVSNSQMAQILGVSRQALSKTPTSTRLQSELQYLDQLLVRLKALTGSLENSRIWLKTGHPDFAGKAPLEYLLEGKVEAVEDLIEAIEMGLPG
jgi:translation initiation factor 2B subunit (eIF-2B alpha/beta/delta family)